MLLRQLFILTITVLLITPETFAQEPSSTTEDPSPAVRVHEKGIQTQFIAADLKNEDDELHMEPIFFTYGFKLNSLFGLEDHKGVIQIILAPFISPITSPKSAVAVGVSLGYRYSYPLSEKLHIFAELTVAPMYFGLDTDEQEEAGFNFLDQGGLGFQYFFKADQAIGIGYRRIHISHLGFNDNDNSGIDGDAGFISYSKFF